MSWVWARSRSTDSVMFCGQRSAVTGLWGSGALSSGSTVSVRPTSSPESVVVHTMRSQNSRGTPRRRTSASAPHSRRSSAVRCMIPTALGCSSVPGYLLTSIDGTPRCESVNDAARPAGPPPTINTDVSLCIPVPSHAWLADPPYLAAGTVERCPQALHGRRLVAAYDLCGELGERDRGVVLVQRADDLRTDRQTMRGSSDRRRDGGQPRQRRM